MTSPGTIDRHESSFPTVLSRVRNTFWIAFLIWTAVGAAVMPFDVGERTVRELVPFSALADILTWVLRISDAVWMALAFGVVYLYVVQARGLMTARLWALVIMIGSGLIEAVGAKTGWPFGDYRYTDNMGFRLFGILPFTIPLAWFVIIATAQFFVDAMRPRWPIWTKAAFVGALATLTDLNLEFVAWKVRAYWIWYPSGTPLADNPPSWPPIENFISWFVVAFLLSLGSQLLRPIMPGQHCPFPTRPALVLFLMNALFLLVHLVRWLRF